MAAEGDSPPSRPRPVAATFIGALGVLWGVALATLGAGVLLGAELQVGTLAENEAEAIGLLVYAAVALVIAVGAFRVRRWAWVMFMTWAAASLALNLLRVFFFAAEPAYSVLAMATLTVFLLTPLDVQVAFGVRTARVDRHDRPGPGDRRDGV